MTVATQVEERGAFLHVRVTGKLTRADYEEFVPVVDRMIEGRGQIRILFEMHEFHGWTAGALWSDLAFGIKHFGSIDRLALVGEKPWQRGLALFCRPFTRASIRYFQSEEIDDARQWLCEEHGRAAERDTDELAGAPEQVAELLRTLGGDDGLERQRARLQLVEMGSTVTHDLIRAARSGNRQLRWEATKALAAIADLNSAETLAQQLEDSFDIAWAAAEGLKVMGREGAEAVLHKLMRHSTSYCVRASAHHALKFMEDRDVREAVAPVVAALDDSAPVEQAPVAAMDALERLRR